MTNFMSLPSFSYNEYADASKAVISSSMQQEYKKKKKKKTKLFIFQVEFA